MDYDYAHTHNPSKGNSAPPESTMPSTNLGAQNKSGAEPSEAPTFKPHTLEEESSDNERDEKEVSGYSVKQERNKISSEYSTSLPAG